MLEIAVEAHALGRGQKRVDVLRRVHFQVETGRLVCVIGPSGCGKTTLLRLVLGLDKPLSGTIGTPPGRVAAVFQEPRLLPWRSVDENIRLALGSSGQSFDVGPLIESVGLAGKASFFPGELSLGQARRAALARAFAVSPDLLLLDEPFASLDQETAARLRETLISMWSHRPTTTLMVTHDLQEAAQLADKVVVLGGRPATVLGSLELSVQRHERDEAYVSQVVAQLIAMNRTSPAG